MAIVLDYKLTGIETLTRSRVINAMKRALERLGNYWFDNFAAKRFTHEAFSEYGFAPRSRKYEAAKARFRPEAAGLPLVLKGDLREQTLSEETRGKIETTRDKLIIRLPTKANLYNPKGPNMAEEIRAVSPGELKEMQDVLVAYIDEELDNEVAPGDRNKGTNAHVARLALRKGSIHSPGPVPYVASARSRPFTSRARRAA